MAEYKDSSYNKSKRKSFPKEEKTRAFNGELKPLMSEAEKEKAQVLDLSYDFSCRIIRLYKFLNEGKLSKASIALKEARESENWLSLLRDNGYLEPRASESLLLDCSRINKILITITAKVRKRING